MELRSQTVDDNQRVLDLRGLKCPLPALMARRTILRAPCGSTVAFIADDPLARVDIPYMCDQEGFELVSVVEQGTAVRVTVRR